jgi:hypothetical protein
MSSNSHSQQTCAMPVASPAKTITGLMQAIVSCDLSTLETFLRGFKNEPNELIPIAEGLARLVNSPTLKITVRKFSWKQRGVTRWGVVCEFYLTRAQRILLVPTEEQFPSVVLQHTPGTVGVVCSDCPKLMLRQVGKIAMLPPVMCPPPLAFNPTPSFVV